MKRISALFLAILFAALLSLSITGCGGTTTTASASPSDAQTSAAPASEAASAASDAAPASAAADSYKGQTLTVAIDSEPQTLLAQAASVSAGTGHIVRCLYTYLHEYDASGSEVPALAESYEWVDNLHLRIHLRQGVKAFDGNDLTAEDVIFSWQLGLQGTASAQYGTPFVPDSFVAEDDYTVVIVFDQPYPYFPQSFFDLGYPIVSKACVEALGGMSQASLTPNCGSGRYNFVEWVPGQYVLLQYNENYWDDTYVPSYEYIKFTFIPDSASRGLAVKSGEADIATGITLSDTFAYTNDASLAIDKFKSGNTGGTVMWYKCDKGPFADENVRLAMNYLVDWKACANILTGDENDSMQTWMNSGSPYYLGPDDRTYDLEKGKELLAQSAYPNGFDFELKIEPTNGYQTVAELIQANLLEAGINATLVNIDYANWFTMFANDDYESYIGGAASLPLSFSLEYFNVDIHLSGPRITSDEMKNFLSIAKTTLDEDERTQAILGLEQYVKDHALMQGICTLSHYALRSTTIAPCIPDNAGYVLAYYVQPAS